MLRTEKSRDAREWGHDEGTAPQTFRKGAMEAEVPFYKSITGNFLVYQDRLKHIFAAIRSSHTQKLLNSFL